MAETGIGLSFDEYGIANTLNQYYLTVPLNQREYKWEKDKVERLLDDLKKADNAGDQIYFLGMIVLARGAKGQLEIADGQQRLATISILIAAVRDYMLQLGDRDGADAYENDYLLKYDPRLKVHKAKLELNFEDKEFFIKTILKRPDRREEYQGRPYNSHERLKIAMETAAKDIRDMVSIFDDPEEKLRRIYDWMDFLKNNAKVIVITVPGHVGNVFKMFETLNARGLPASQIDILKNYLFDKGKERMAEIHPKWTSMVATIESQGGDDLLVDFIRHYWIAHYGPTYEAELGDAIEKQVKSERQVVDTAMALDLFAGDYVALLTPREHARWDDFSRQTRDCIYTITRELRVEQIRPLLLAIGRYLEVSEAQKAFHLCLSWSVRFLISGGGGGGVLDRHYGLRAKEISGREIMTVEQLADRMKTVVPNDEVFKTSFEVASASRMYLVRYYLRAIELYLKEDPNPAFVPNEDPKAINVEHILPITPGPQWKIDVDEAATWYKRLGNMVLLDAIKNTKIGNKAFDEKKQALVESSYLTTQKAGKNNSWGPDEIRERQIWLAKYVPKVWPI
jgi:hypothetical protein